uniref:Uncharacterized protein n=1 Tax=Wenzhou noda-like virus 7 TaxID=1923591 RepID=A0A1L3KH07_9VIRU|nr:hypothetical protein 2 [Wenzhou noda-like virus 7]
MDTLSLALQEIVRGVALLPRSMHVVVENLKSTLRTALSMTTPATMISLPLETLRWIIRFLRQAGMKLWPLLTRATTSLRRAGTGCLEMATLPCSIPLPLPQLQVLTENAPSLLRTTLLNTSSQVAQLGGTEFGIGLLAENTSYFISRTVKRLTCHGTGGSRGPSCHCAGSKPSLSLRSSMLDLSLAYLIARSCGLSPSIRLGCMIGSLSRSISGDLGGLTTLASLGLAGICIARSSMGN